MNLQSLLLIVFSIDVDIPLTYVLNINSLRHAMLLKIDYSSISYKLRSNVCTKTCQIATLTHTGSCVKLAALFPRFTYLHSSYFAFTSLNNENMGYKNLNHAAHPLYTPLARFSFIRICIRLRGRLNFYLTLLE